METLEIDSACCIVESDKDRYQKARNEERMPMEIPITIKTTFNRFFKSKGQLTCGSWPFIIPDELYDNEKGLNLKEPENFL